MLKMMAEQQKTTFKELTERHGFVFMLKLISSAAAAFLLSGSEIGGAPSGLSVALVGALTPWQGMAAFVGSLIGYAVHGGMYLRTGEIAAMVLIIGVRTIYKELLRREMSPLLSGGITGVMLFFSGTVMCILTSGGFAAVAVQLFRALFCAAACFFLLRTAEYIFRERNIPISGTYGLSAAVIFTIAVSALCSVEIAELNFGRIAGILLSLYAAGKYGIYGGCFMSALSLCGFTLCDPALGEGAVFIPAAVAVASAVMHCGGLPTVFAFIAANGAGLIVCGTVDGFSMLCDVMAAAALYIITSEEVIALAPLPKHDGNILSARMNFAADAVAGVRESVEQVAAALEKQDKNRDPAAEVSNRVCSGCRGRMNCWERSFEQTYSRFAGAKAMLLDKTELSDSDMTAFSTCFHRADILREFNTLSLRNAKEKAAAARLSQSRELLYEQLSAIEELLRGIGSEKAAGREYDSCGAKAVKSALLSLCCKNVQVSVWREKGRVYVESFFFGESEVGDEDFCDTVSDAVGAELDLPQRTVQNGVTRLCFWERTRYRLEIAGYQYSCEGKICGDTYESFTDGVGNAYVILSDGMGSGKQAALDSVMTASLLKKLLSAGVEYNAAIKLINSSMLLKSSEERFATLDIACLNLYTGELELMKSGAAATFIKMGERVKKIECRGIPIGISSRCTPSRSFEKLTAGDCILMVSDGVEGLLPTDIRDILLRSGEVTSKELSRRIVERALVQINENVSADTVKRADDMTAVALKITRNDD